MTKPRPYSLDADYQPEDPLPEYDWRNYAMTLREEIANAIWRGKDKRKGLDEERDKCDLEVRELGPDDNLWSMTDAVLEVIAKRFRYDQ